MLLRASRNDARPGILKSEGFKVPQDRMVDDEPASHRILSFLFRSERVVGVDHVVNEVVTFPAKPTEVSRLNVEPVSINNVVAIDVVRGTAKCAALWSFVRLPAF
jgi:hypothetical protein